MYRCDQLHPVSEPTSSPLHMFKNNRAMAISPPFPSSSLTDMTNSQYLISPSADPNQSNIDHITCLERSLCSNFLCCGAQLADLHALIEHFEEDHIMVLAPNGKRVYPREGLRSVPLHSIQTSFTNTPVSPRASSESPSSSSSSGSSSAPSTPSDFSSPTSGPFATRKSSLTTATVPPVYTPFTPSLPVDPADPYPDAYEITALHEGYQFATGVDVYPSMLPLLPPPVAAEIMSPLSSSDDDEDQEMSDCSAVDALASPSPLPLPTIVGVGAQGPSQVSQSINVTPKKHIKPTCTPPRGRPSVKLSCEALKAGSPTATKSKSKKVSMNGPTAASRRREKLFRCPNPRCTKSYLNPNGLKYHTEKGTCSLEDEESLPLNGGDVDMEVQSDQVPGTLIPTNPSPTSNLTLDAEARVPSGPELGPNSQLTVPYPRPYPTPMGGVHAPYYHNRPSADAAATPLPVPSVNAHTPTSNSNDDSARAETPRQYPPTPRPAQQQQPQQQQQQQPLTYHYPVPSYPQLGGPNALLAGYTTTFVHRPPRFSAGSVVNIVAPSPAGPVAAAGQHSGAQGADGSPSSSSLTPTFSLPLYPPQPLALSASSSAS